MDGSIASLFRCGGNQALRIPCEFELPGTTAHPGCRRQSRIRALERNLRRCDRALPGRHQNIAETIQ